MILVSTKAWACWETPWLGRLHGWVDILAGVDWSSFLLALGGSPYVNTNPLGKFDVYHNVSLPGSRGSLPLSRILSPCKMRRGHESRTHEPMVAGSTVDWAWFSWCQGERQLEAKTWEVPPKTLEVWVRKRQPLHVFF